MATSLQSTFNVSKSRKASFSADFLERGSVRCAFLTKMFRDSLLKRRCLREIGHALVLAIFPTAEFAQHVDALVALQDVAFFCTTDSFSKAGMS
jgi:hypothetical protein